MAAAVMSLFPYEIMIVNWEHNGGKRTRNFELENMDNTEFSYATYHVARTNTAKGDNLGY